MAESELTAGPEVGEPPAIESASPPAPPEVSGSPSPAPASAPDREAARRERIDPQGTALERAYRAAEERIAAQHTESSPQPAGQAGAPGAASTPVVEAPAADPEAGTSAVAPEASPDSTPSAPANWPIERREAFAKLPPEARSVVQAIASDLQAGYTKTTQAVAEIKQSFPVLAQAVEQSGASPERVVEYARAGALFDRDPRAALEHLAKQAGVPVWFDAPAANQDEPPEFVDVKELTAWVEKRTEARIAQTWKAEHERLAQAQQREQARAFLEREMAEAAKLPGFAERADTVRELIARSNGYLSPEQAYWFSQLDTLRSEAQQAPALRAELAKLKRAEEARKKALTAPLGRSNGSTPPARAADPLEAAYERAAARLGTGRTV